MPQSFDIVRPVPHNDEGFLRPQAWDEAKAAFGYGGDIAEMLARLEECSIASPRLLLAAAIHAFLQMDDKERAAALRSYLSTPLARSDSNSSPPPPKPRATSAPGKAKSGNLAKLS